MKARLRRSNTMALKALKRLQVIAQDRQPRRGTAEHPKNSWMWEFNLVKQLEDMGLRHAIGSSCCFGGDRQKFYSFFGTSEEICDELTRPCPGHEGLLSYEVTQNPDGSLHYPTEEESEYPRGLCVAYARGLKRQMAKEKVFESVVQEQREEWYQAQLKDSTARLSDPKVARSLAAYTFSGWRCPWPGALRWITCAIFCAVHR